MPQEKVMLANPSSGTIPCRFADVEEFGGGGGGGISDAENLGTGQPVFKDKSGNRLRFKTLLPGANVTLTPTANDEVEIAAPNAAPAGEPYDIQYNAGGVFGASARLKAFTGEGAQIQLRPSLSAPFDTMGLTLHTSLEGPGVVTGGLQATVGNGNSYSLMIDIVDVAESAFLRLTSERAATQRAELSAIRAVMVLDALPSPRIRFHVNESSTPIAQFAFIDDFDSAAIGFFGALSEQRQTISSPAGNTYGPNERNLLNEIRDALLSYGLLAQG